MKWYVAHAIILVRYKDGNQNNFPIWENLILIQASSDKEAWTKAEIAARVSEGDDQNSFTCDNRPAEQVFKVDFTPKNGQ